MLLNQGNTQGFIECHYKTREMAFLSKQSLNPHRGMHKVTGTTNKQSELEMSHLCMIMFEDYSCAWLATHGRRVT